MFQEVPSLVFWRLKEKERNTDNPRLMTKIEAKVSVAKRSVC